MPRFDKDSFPSSGSYYQETCYARPYAREQEEIPEPTPEEVEATRAARLLEKEATTRNSNSLVLWFSHGGRTWYVDSGNGCPYLRGFSPDQSSDWVFIPVPCGWMEEVPYDWRGDDYCKEWVDAAVHLIDEKLKIERI